MYFYIPKDYTNIFVVISFSVIDYTAEDIGKILDEEFDICVRTGFHCAPLVHEFINSVEYGGTVRVGLNYFNNKNDIDTLIEAIKSL